MQLVISQRQTTGDQCKETGGCCFRENHANTNEYSNAGYLINIINISIAATDDTDQL